jgi:hypothetical protein
MCGVGVAGAFPSHNCPWQRFSELFVTQYIQFGNACSLPFGELSTVLAGRQLRMHFGDG